jgi:response regulator RpfG family c-di-GMP phosphodiesterase
MVKRILCVDDEPNVLKAFERQFHNRFEVQTALGPELGLQAISGQDPFAVVVSDLQMPGMNGIEFLRRVREISPDTVRIMLTGQADFKAAIAAVNQGAIFQFLSKPCPADMLARALEAAIDQYRLVTSEKELLEKTLHGAVAVLSEVLGLVNPPAFSRSHRITRYVRHIAESLQLPGVWQFELAAMLSQIGCVTVPVEVLDKAAVALPLTPDESALLGSQSTVGRNLLAKIPRLEAVAKMVENQAKPWPNPAGQPDAAVLGAQLLKIALDFDEQTVRGASIDTVLAQMKTRKEYYQPFVLALQEVKLEESQSETRRVSVIQLKSGMIIGEDVRAKNGLLLLAKGQEITESAIARVQGFAVTVGVKEPIMVTMPRDGLRASSAAAPEALQRS